MIKINITDTKNPSLEEWFLQLNSRWQIGDKDKEKIQRLTNKIIRKSGRETKKEKKEDNLNLLKKWHPGK